MHTALSWFRLKFHSIVIGNSFYLRTRVGWMPPDVGKDVREMARRHFEHVARTVIRPTKDWLQETYLVTEIHEIQNALGEQPTAAELLTSYGGEICAIGAGRDNPSCVRACEQTLQTSLSYYPRDLIVVGSYAAVVYDRSEDAAAAAQILGYSKMQLLEFRYYDRLMTQVLADFYDALERKRNVLFSRWSVPRDARRFNTVRLDVMELTEPIDNAIKFVSDAYYVHVYRLSAKRIGVPDYRTLVEERRRLGLMNEDGGEGGIRSIECVALYRLA